MRFGTRGFDGAGGAAGGKARARWPDGILQAIQPNDGKYEAGDIAMEMISVIPVRPVALAELAELTRSLGGRPNGSPGSNLVERGSATVYINSLTGDEPQVSPTERIGLTISRSDGSEELAFEIAVAMLRRWGGSIDWSGLEFLERWFMEWNSKKR